jgi:pSer/pThr/pTyr-binding forkhead associated (FHA) protein
LITEDLIRAAADELQWVEFSERLREQERKLEATGQLANQGSSLAKLEVLFQDQFVADFNLPIGRAIIGRTPDNDLQIRSKFVSRHHAQVVSDRTHSVLEDLNSTNGVFIKSKRVKRQDLADGDVIQLGEHKLLYRDLRRGLRVAEDYDDDEQLDDEDAEDAVEEEDLERQD